LYINRVPIARLAGRSGRCGLAPSAAQVLRTLHVAGWTALCGFYAQPPD
jgi:hypothetical protein